MYDKLTVKPDTLLITSPKHACELKLSKEAGTYAERYEEELKAGTSWDWKGFDSNPGRDCREAIQDEISMGWQKGCTFINDARQSVLEASLAAPMNRRLKISNGHMTGFNPHVPALLRGEAGAYSQWSRKPKTQAVRLICELVASSFLQAADLVWRGAACLVIADLLQEAGYAVEIWASNTLSNYNGPSGHFVSAVCVKGADETPIPDMLASVLVSPRFYRCSMLPGIGHMPYRVNQGLGRCASLDPKLLDGTSLDDLKDGIYIAECFSKSAAINKINEVVKELNNANQR